MNTEAEKNHLKLKRRDQMQITVNKYNIRAIKTELRLSGFHRYLHRPSIKNKEFECTLKPLYKKNKTPGQAHSSRYPYYALCK